MNGLAIVTALLVLFGLFLWAVIHVGHRDDPPEYDEPDDGWNAAA